MKKTATIFAAMLAMAALAGSASAALRVPQVPLSDGSLQAYLNSKGESINAATDQNAVQVWQSTVSNNATFTLMIELGSFAPNNAIGMYNGNSPAPALYQVFPGAAQAGWFATASWRTSPTRVVVNLFDADGVFQGSTVYLGADPTAVGYYLMSPTNMSYTQDARNAGGSARALAYAGTGVNSGQWWLAFEDWLDGNFSDAILFLESVAPTPTQTTSWGQLKKRFN